MCFLFRRFIRTKRCEDIYQLGTDRIVIIQFGSGDAANYIILELFANGNIILTDYKYEILALLRSHEADSDEISVKVAELYPVHIYGSASLPSLAEESSDTGILAMDNESFRQWINEKDEEQQIWQLKNAKEGKKDKSKRMTLRQLLLSKDSGVSSYGAEIIDHCLLTAGLQPHLRIDEIQYDAMSDNISQLLTEFRVTAPRLLKDLNVVGSPGFIIYNQRTNNHQKQSHPGNLLIISYPAYLIPP